MRSLFALVIFGCLSIPPAIADQSSDAAAAYSRSDWSTVVQFYGQRTRTQPDDAEAWYRLGRGLEETRHYAEARAAFEHASQLKYPSPTTGVHIAANAVAAGDRSGALAALESMAESGFGFPRLITADARFEPIKNEPRFIAALQKMNYNGSPCKDPAHPEFRQLDFWVGEWNVFDTQGNQVGESSVQKIINDCVIFENWSGALGRTGKSFNKYDASGKQWEQYWVDESPTRQFYSGRYENKRMLYSGEFTNPKGQHVTTRLTFFDQPDGTVRQFFETSTDEGKTWQVGYDYVYRRK